MGIDAVERTEALQQVVCRLRPDARYTRDIVRAVAHKSLQIDEALRLQPVFRAEDVRRVALRPRLPALRVHQAHGDVLVDELQAVAVSRQDNAVPPGLLAQTADRAEHIVRLPALAGIDRDVHRGEHLLHDRHLHGKLLRHGVARSLVAVIAQMAERRRMQVERHAQRVRFFLAALFFQNIQKAVDRIGIKSVTGCQRPHAVKRAVDDAVPVQDHQLHMVSPSIRCASTLRPAAYR